METNTPLDPAGRKRKLRLLLVEDSEADAILLLRDLTKAGFDIEHERVCTRETMQEALSKPRWDLVISDFSMPKFDALEALSLARASGYDLPFIIVSGTIGEETAVSAMKAGAHDYIMKGNALRLIPAVERELRDAKVRAVQAEAEQSLYESEEKFRFMFQHSPVPTWIADLGTLRFTDVNEAAVVHYGYSRREFLQLKMTDLEIADKPSDAESDANASSRLSHRRVADGRHRRKNGETIDVEVHSDVLELGGKKFLLTIARDITHHKQIERDLIKASQAALEASQAKSQFLANVSHEIRTPLNGIMGMTEILAGTKLLREQKETVETIRQSADSLFSIVNDVLDFSTIESGKMELIVSDFNLGNILREAVEPFGPVLKKKGLVLETVTDSDVPSDLRGDAGRIGQILKNLIDNAVKFTARGRVVVRVHKEGGDDDSVLARISVQDSGIGIPEAANGLIFKPFSQVDSSLTRKYGGTGLGLTLCKRLIDLMDGDIGFESVGGMGSTFWFQLRLKKSSRPSPKTSVGGMSGRVLIVDDNPISQKVFIAMLKRARYEARAADNEEEALSLLKKNAYDLILMDCEMSGLDGIHMTRCIRQQEDSSGRRTPIVALTGHALQSDRERFLKAGMDDYVAKPADLGDVALLVNKWANPGSTEGFL